MMTHLPQYAQAMEAAAQRVGIPLKLSGATMNWTHRVSSLGPALLNVLSTVLSGVTGVLTVAVLTIYLLVDGHRVGMGLMRQMLMVRVALTPGTLLAHWAWLPIGVPGAPSLAALLLWRLR